MGAVIKTGSPAPSFSLVDIDQRSHTLTAYRGQVVVLVFWSPACPWSRRAAGALREMQSAWDQQVAVLFIAPNGNQDPESLRAAARQGQTAPLLLDPDQQVTRAFSAQVTPQVFVIDPEGILRYQGAFDNVSASQPEASINYLWEAVEAVLAGERPAPGAIPAYGCQIRFD